ncbi:STAS domain-containing protein [Fusibacter ferrireducens]|uniref:STAS domain-containing protein n=1 Tax=Fusibacter ferrireducens TaxID=2785058 RepID=A0ABR9ZY54_9FIRM|nr:STAS domain-containing protein [Fusibacter ferrireducens]MBF4695398.1 STAS domain-containing protein [Fusibacter ferrireducens]
MEKIKIDGSIKLTLTEGLTANNVPKFNEGLKELIPPDEAFKSLILDLGQIDNIDSVGVTFVISLFKQMKNNEKAFKVSGASEDIISLFKLMKLDQFFEMID